ncbi:ArsR/SmtB family transcription factor [Nonomuraea sp. bgisy101]|uniref:ArsR/SmtB family transcription factor n=1 Tax=Nonomuraea sp. bgisy101 TaxID=3413784 RepID=UPI003D703350
MQEERRPPLSDPKAMRALAHPARLSMLNELIMRRTATATTLAEVVGVSPSAASYHLRMLEKYGFVQDAPASGDARERMWAIAPGGITFGYENDDGHGIREAKRLLVDSIWADKDSEARRALEAAPSESEEWRDAMSFGRAHLMITAAELKELRERIEELVRPYSTSSRTDAPEAARYAEMHLSLFPRAARSTPGLPTEDHDAASVAAEDHAAPGARPEDRDAPGAPAGDRGAPGAPAADRDATGG